MSELKTNLPTKPGPYWWRSKEGDDWEIWHIDENVNQPGLTARKGYVSMRPSAMGGQWSRIPEPDEGQEMHLIADGSGDGKGF